jgi:hypothetical protein
MLSQTQRNAVFTNIATAYTIDANLYTATKTYKEHWDGEIDTPIIMLSYPSDAKKERTTIGRESEWDLAKLKINIFTRTSHTNGTHGSKIAQEIARTLLLWFKQDADTDLNANGLSIMETYPATDVQSTDPKLYVMQFEVDLKYELF